MPYDPIRDAPGFRITLRQLSDVERLTSQAIVDLFNKQRARGDNLSISRATLDRFVQGEDVTKIRELRAIYQLLHAHPAYARYFVSAETVPPPAPPPAADRPFAHALGAMFAAADGTDARARTEDMRIALPGKFVLMRRDHDRVTLENGVRVSCLDIEAADDGVVLEESQSYLTPDDGMPFEQTDRGYLFAHGPLTYFLLKEIGGTAVKFGVIELTLPEAERRLPVQYFQGYIVVASRRGVFPRTRFAARRQPGGQPAIPSGIVRLDDIADPRATEHLRLDFAPEGAARPV